MHPWSRQAIERTPRRFRRPVALAVRTADGALKDRLPGLAAEIAFWVLLSLPSLLLTAIAAASVFGTVDGQGWEDQLVTRVAEVARVALTEATVQNLVVDQLRGLLEQADPTLVSIAALVTIWTASRAVRVVLTALTIVYDRYDHRPGWQDRLLGFAITFGALLIGIVLAPLLIAGPAFGEALQDWIELDLGVLPAVWRALYWPTTVLMATLAISLLYYLGVPGRTRWLRSLPGAVLATSVWLAGSAGLRLYGAWIAGGESAYGPLAGPVVVLLWLWLTGFAVLLGGELNAQSDHVWPVGGQGVDELGVLVGDVVPDLDPHDDRGQTAGPDTDDSAEAETTRPINSPPAPRS